MLCLFLLDRYCMYICMNHIHFPSPWLWSELSANANRLQLFPCVHRLTDRNMGAVLYRAITVIWVWLRLVLLVLIVYWAGLLCQFLELHWPLKINISYTSMSAVSFNFVATNISMSCNIQWHQLAVALELKKNQFLWFFNKPTLYFNNNNNNNNIYWVFIQEV
jgi:hypothetical protein